MKKLGQQGFTLVELMVATAITGILILVIMGFLTNSLVRISIDSARADILRNAQISLDTVTQDIRISSNAYGTSSLLDEHAPGGDDTWESSTTVLVLATAAQDSSNNILFADELHYTSHKNNTIYFVRDRVLYKRVLAVDVPNNAARTTCPEDQATDTCSADSVLARDVNNFTLRYFDGNGSEVEPSNARSVEVSLDLAAHKYGQPVEASYKTRTVFRNQ